MPSELRWPANAARLEGEPSRRALRALTPRCDERHVQGTSAWLMSSGQSSGVWSEEGAMGSGGREVRDMAGFGGQTQGVSGPSLLDRVHLPPLIQSSGAPQGVCAARMCLLLGH